MFGGWCYRSCAFSCLFERCLEQIAPQDVVVLGRVSIIVKNSQHLPTSIHFSQKSDLPRGFHSCSRYPLTVSPLTAVTASISQTRCLLILPSGRYASYRLVSRNESSWSLSLAPPISPRAAGHWTLSTRTMVSPRPAWFSIGDIMRRHPRTDHFHHFPSCNPAKNLPFALDILGLQFLA